MTENAFQDYYPDDVSHCYGCGRLNPHGLQIKSTWDGDTAVCTFRPRPEHTSVPGFAYGGLLASLIDCHGTGTAAAAAYREAGRPMDSLPAFRYVTASLQVDFLKPTPIDRELVVRGTVTEIKGKKTVVTETVHSGDTLCARGTVIAVRMPESMVPKP